MTQVHSGENLKGHWSQVEQDAFVLGLNVHGRNWKLIQLLVKTRTLTQIRTHAQKHFDKAAIAEELSNLPV
jgi:SHAQKYF class myb-like DNA-binding protein